MAGGLVLAGAALLLVVGSPDIPLLDPDESRFARTSVEMLRSRDLVVPTFQGEPRLVKPPLLHWVQSFVFRWLGASSFSARLHSFLATMGSLLLVTWVARRRFGPEAGVWAGAIFATMPLVLVPGRIGALDALLSVHVLAIVVLDLTGLEAEQAPSGGRSLCIGGLLGLAFLIKGPVGVVLPLLLVLAGRTACRREAAPALTTVLRVSAGWALVVLPWGLAFLHRIGWGATIRTLREEALERYFAAEVHREPPWFFGPVLLVGLAPWIAPLALALGRAWRLRRSPTARTAIYCAAALLAGVAFFSIGQGKLASYVIPLAPFAALLVTWELGHQISSPKGGSGPALLAATVAASALILGMATARFMQPEVRATAWIGAGVLGAGAVAAGICALRRKPRLAYASVAVSTGLFLGAVVTLLFPAIGGTKSAAPLIAAVPQLSSGRPIVTVELRIPGLVFYLDRAVEVVEMGGLESRLARDDSALYVFADVDLPEVPRSLLPILRSVGRHGKYHVFEKPERGLKIDNY